MNEELLTLLIGQQRTDPIASQLADHSLARFNDNSSQVVNASQQAFVQQQGAQFAQLLSLTAELTQKGIKP